MHSCLTFFYIIKFSDARYNCHALYITEACSSFAAQTTEAVLDDLLKDINCGKFNHHHDDNLDTPDDQESSLMLSQIEASTPYKEVPEDSVCSFAMNEVRSKSTRKTYVDRVERVIAQQYHRDKQMTSASYLDPGSAHCWHVWY